MNISAVIRKPAEQKKILSQLSEGKIDIIIGTHKLVGQDVKFKDLGLLVIDEEQRFGVSVKEKLKKIKANVDTLTLLQLLFREHCSFHLWEPVIFL